MRREPAHARGVYRHLVERARRAVERYGHLDGNPYRRRLARLEAGEPVEVAARELPGRPGDYGLAGWDRVAVWPDDRVEVVGRRTLP